MLPFYDGKATGYGEGWDAARDAIAAISEEMRAQAATLPEDESLALYRDVIMIHERIWRGLLEGRAAAVEAYRAALPAGMPINNSRAGILGQAPGFASTS